MLNQIIYLSLAWVVSRIPGHLNLLKRLETGVFFFCWRLALQAKDEVQIDPSTPLGVNLAATLREQAESEYHHAQVFCSLVGGKFKLSAGGLFEREEKSAFKWSRIDWDSTESFRADGLSRKYFTARVFFANRFAKDYDWANKLAYMAVLEEFQTCFYQQLVKFVPYHEQLEIICDDEAEHSEKLKIALISLVGSDSSAPLLGRWRSRLTISLLFIPLDLAGILAAVVMTRMYATRIRFNQSPNHRN